jgi:hypothetical protein
VPPIIHRRKGAGRDKCNYKVGNSFVQQNFFVGTFQLRELLKRALWLHKPFFLSHFCSGFDNRNTGKGQPS